MTYCDRCVGSRPVTKKKKLSVSCDDCKAVMDCNTRLNMVELMKKVQPAIDQLWRMGLIKNEAKGIPVHAVLATLDSEENPMLELRATRDIEVPNTVEGIKIRLLVCEPYYH